MRPRTSKNLFRDKKYRGHKSSSCTKCRRKIQNATEETRKTDLFKKELLAIHKKSIAKKKPQKGVPRSRDLSRFVAHGLVGSSVGLPMPFASGNRSMELRPPAALRRGFFGGAGAGLTPRTRAQPNRRMQAGVLTSAYLARFVAPPPPAAVAAAAMRRQAQGQGTSPSAPFFPSVPPQP